MYLSHSYHTCQSAPEVTMTENTRSYFLRNEMIDPHLGPATSWTRSYLYLFKTHLISDPE